jgi:transcriptional regulator with XRE-family HTH domain
MEQENAGQRLAQWMEHNDWTPRMLADRLGVTAAYVRMLCDGTRDRPSDAVAEQLAHITEDEPDYWVRQFGFSRISKRGRRGAMTDLTKLEFAATAEEHIKTAERLTDNAGAIGNTEQVLAAATLAIAHAQIAQAIMTRSRGMF